MVSHKIKGLISAPFTPMKPNGDINLEVIPSYAQKLKKDGLKGVFVCGTTGEGMLMTVLERKAVTERWLLEQTDEFKVIVHVGTTSARTSKELSEHAQQNKAAGIGAMGPMFLKPSKTEDLVAFCAEVASGAPDLPFYYYHIPTVSNIYLSMVEFIDLAKERIPNFAGLKFTANNLMEMQQCLNKDNGKWDILHGYDEMLLAGLAFGIKGAVGSTYNFMAPLYRGIIRDFENGNIEAAKEKQLQSVRVIEVLLNHGGGMVTGKALMKTVGVDCGPCRAPLSQLTDTQYSEFIDDLKNSGFYELVDLN